MIREPFRDELPKLALDGQVDFGDEIDRPFLVHANNLAELRHLHVAGAHYGLNRCRQENRVCGHAAGIASAQSTDSRCRSVG